MALSLMEVVANHLADMPGQILPIYTMQFPSDVANCIAIFPTGGGVGGNIGNKPTMCTASDGGIDYIDYPGVQIQVRYTNPYDAFVLAEAIRVWLDDNLPAGYLRCDTNRSCPDDLTSNADLEMNLGPCFRMSVDFSMIKIRA
jgi:hypothetical protein